MNKYIKPILVCVMLIAQCSFLNISGQQTTIYYEDFGNGLLPNDWQADPNFIFSSNSALFNTPNASGELITPVLDLSSYDSIYLVSQFEYDIAISDNIEIQISFDGGINFNHSFDMKNASSSDIYLPNLDTDFSNIVIKYHIDFTDNANSCLWVLYNMRLIGERCGGKYTVNTENGEDKNLRYLDCLPLSNPVNLTINLYNDYRPEIIVQILLFVH